MSKRLKPKLWEAVADLLFKRDGPLCKYENCHFKTPPLEQALVQPLRTHAVPQREWTTINHIDGNPDDYREENLNLMHQACNSSYYHDQNRRARLLALLGKQAEEHPPVHPLAQASVSREREDSAAPSISVSLGSKSTEELQGMLPKFRVIPRESDAYSNRKSHECKPIYYERAFAMLTAGAPRGEWPTYDEMNNSLAMQVGEVPQSTGRYLNMLISEVGPFDQIPHPVTNVEIITFRHQEYAYLTPPELMELFPPQGLRMVDPKREKELIDVAERRMKEAPIKQLTLGKEASR